MMRRILWIAVVVLIVLAALHEFSMHPVARGDGVLAPDAIPRE